MGYRAAAGGEKQGPAAAVVGMSIVCGCGLYRAFSGECHPSRPTAYGASRTTAAAWHHSNLECRTSSAIRPSVCPVRSTLQRGRRVDDIVWEREAREPAALDKSRPRATRHGPHARWKSQSRAASRHPCRRPNPCARSAVHVKARKEVRALPSIARSTGSAWPCGYEPSNSGSV
ncbi:hypothetical protein GY45DRAFT_638443 [Cubamyces sp. BRFM 1775]|nr:hypothetical protein GY45DRAFT_638443 [Cubamyces sp. BRFM 1775]